MDEAKGRWARNGGGEKRFKRARRKNGKMDRRRKSLGRKWWWRLEKVQEGAENGTGRGEDQEMVWRERDVEGVRACVEGFDGGGRKGKKVVWAAGMVWAKAGRRSIGGRHGLGPKRGRRCRGEGARCVAGERYGSG